jgi:hypothetical protein
VLSSVRGRQTDPQPFNIAAVAVAVYIRNWGRTVCGLLVWLVVGAGVGRGLTTAPDHSTLVGVAFVELATLAALVRTFRAGVLVTDDRIVIRNFFRSYSVPWSQVVAFSPSWDDPQHHTVGVLTVDDRRISFSALRNMAGWAMFSPQRYYAGTALSRPANRVAEEIERMLERHSGSSAERPS